MLKRRRFAEARDHWLRGGTGQPRNRAMREPHTPLHHPWKTIRKSFGSKWGQDIEKIRQNNGGNQGVRITAIEGGMEGWREG